MTSEDEPHPSGDFFVDRPGDGVRPSEEAIRRRLIDRRRKFDEAEDAARLSTRLRRRFAGPAPAKRGSSRTSPRGGPSRTLYATLRERPVLAFCGMAVLSSGLLAATALLWIRPTSETPTQPTFDQRESPEITELSISQGQVTASRGADSRLPDTADGEEKMPRPAEARRSAGSEQSSRELEKPASQTSALAADDILDDASLRVERRASGMPPTRTKEFIDPVAMALALRLPGQTDKPSVTSDGPALDPTFTGSLYSALPGLAGTGLAEAGAISSATGEKSSLNERLSDDGVMASLVELSEGGIVPPSAAAQDLVAISPSILLQAPAEKDAPDSAQTSIKGGESPVPQPARATANAAVKMRAQADNDGKIVAILSKGDALEVLSCRGWCEVKDAEGRQGFVYESFIDRPEGD